MPSPFNVRHPPQAANWSRGVFCGLRLAESRSGHSSTLQALLAYPNPWEPRTLTRSGADAPTLDPEDINTTTLSELEPTDVAPLSPRNDVENAVQTPTAPFPELPSDDSEDIETTTSSELEPTDVAPLSSENHAENAVRSPAAPFPEPPFNDSEDIETTTSSELEPTDVAPLSSENHAENAVRSPAAPFPEPPFNDSEDIETTTSPELEPTDVAPPSPRNDVENPVQTLAAVAPPSQPDGLSSALASSHPIPECVPGPSTSTSLQHSRGGSEMLPNPLPELPTRAEGQPRPFNHFDSSRHHYGPSFTSTTINEGPRTEIKHIENAHFAGDPSALLWQTLPKQRDLSGQYSVYLEGSREDTVQDALSWMRDPSSELAFFIYGPAGLGKSMLARHLTHRIHAEGRLAASVSLNSLPSDARGPESVVKLLAREIAEAYPRAIPAIHKAIRSYKGAQLVDHVKGYLGDPVRSLGLRDPLIVLFDAIDEWESHAALIKALSSLTPSQFPVKFILLGRSDPRARGFTEDSIRPYPLQPVSTIIMEQYFKEQFEDVEWESGQHPGPWRITQLAELANGLFIWATVACSLLQKRLSRLSPNEILDSILAARQSLGDSERLATLYHQAIVWLFPDSDDQDLFREYFGATLALQEPLPIAGFSALANIRIPAISTIQANLKALQIRQARDYEGDVMVYPANTIFHSSLLEYLKSTSTPPHIAFHIPLLGGHSQLAQCCLKELPRFLPSAQHLDPIHLPSQRQYAVKYLVTHIHLGSPPVQPGSGNIERDGLELCSALEQIGINSMGQWGSLLVRLFKRGTAANHTDYAGYAENQVAQLLQDVAKTLGAGDIFPLPTSFQISCLEVAVRLRPEDGRIWGDLGWALLDAAVETSSIDASTRAVVAQRNALDTVGGIGGDGERESSLASALRWRFELARKTEDLDRAIALHRDGLALRPPGHDRRAASASSLAEALYSRAKQSWPTHNMDAAIYRAWVVLQNYPLPGHPYRGRPLRDLAVSLHLRGEKLGWIPDLYEAIYLERDVLRHHTPEHLAYLQSLPDLTASLQSRAASSGLAGLKRETLEHHTVGHPNPTSSLTEAAVSLLSRAKRSESILDMDEAVHLLGEVLEHRPQENPYDAEPHVRLSDCHHRHHGESGSSPDLDEAVRLSREALQHRAGHADRAMPLRCLADSLHYRFHQVGSMRDLTEAIALEREFLELYPPGHERRATTFRNLVTSYRILFEKTGSVPDIDEAICLGREALQHQPTGHPYRIPSLGALVDSLLSRFRRLESMSDLTEAITLEREVLELYPPGGEFRAMVVHNLAVLHHTLFMKSGSVSDNDEATRLSREALQHQPAGHADRTVSLSTLVDSLLSRFRQVESMSDPTDVIGLEREILEIYPPGHEHRPTTVRNPVTSEKTGSIPDIDEAICLSREALQRQPAGHADRAVSLGCLVDCLFLRFRQVGTMDNLTEAITLQRELLELYPPGHEHRARAVLNLAALRLLSAKSGPIPDIDEVVRLCREVLQHRPAGHADRAISLQCLAGSLFHRFGQVGSVGDLTETIAVERELLELRPPGHEARAETLLSLATSHYILFNQSRSIPAIDETIRLCREVLQHRSAGHADRTVLLRALVDSLISRFRQVESTSDLTEAIALERELLELYPPGHEHRAMTIRNLATFHHTLSTKSGSVSDIDETIRLYKEVLKHQPAGHAYRAFSVGRLVNSLSARFHKVGSTSDLTEAIALERELLELYPPGHEHRAMTIRNLATFHYILSEKTGSIPNIDEAIHLSREALQDHSAGHADRADFLRCLVDCLSWRFRQVGTMDNLTEAITLQRELLELYPPGHGHRARTAFGLAALHLLSAESGPILNIDEVICLCREALQHWSAGHADRAILLQCLVNSLSLRFDQIGSMGDLTEQISLERELLELHLPGHEHRPRTLKGLAVLLRSLSEKSGSPTHLNEAIDLEREADAMNETTIATIPILLHPLQTPRHIAPSH